MNASTGATIHAGPVSVRFLVEAEESGGSVSVFECGVPPDVRTPAPHSHDGFEETIYGLEGVSTWTVNGTAHEVGPGEAVCIRRGRSTASRTTGSRRPGSWRSPLRGSSGRGTSIEIGEVVAAAQGGPPDLAAIGEVMRRHGLTPAPAAS